MADWAALTLVGTAFYYPQLGNISVAIADTASTGMNTTLSVSDNYGFSQAESCPIFKALLASLGGLPTITCAPVGGRDVAGARARGPAGEPRRGIF